jgi:hypothetical protein
MAILENTNEAALGTRNAFVAKGLDNLKNNGSRKIVRGTS